MEFFAERLWKVEPNGDSRSFFGYERHQKPDLSAGGTIKQLWSNLSQATSNIKPDPRTTHHWDDQRATKTKVDMWTTPSLNALVCFGVESR